NIITADRNHPCVVIYSMTSELDINLENPAQYHWFCHTLPQLARRLNPAALLFDVTAGFCRSNATRHGPRETDLLEDVLENSHSFTPLSGRINVPDEVAKPFFLHEWNWTTSLPNPDIISRYENLPLVPVQVPEMVETAKARGLLDELAAMYEASRRLKHVLRKDALEQAYAHPKVAGYHHWLIHDVAYCPEGVFNEFWDDPSDVLPAEFRTYNDDTVLVIEDGDRRDFFYEQPVPIGLKIAHFGAQSLHNATVRWRLMRGDIAVSEGSQEVGPVACGQRLDIEPLGLKPLQGQAAAALELVCELWEGTSKLAWNHWTLWFFPRLEGLKYSSRVVATQPLPAALGVFRKPYDPLAPPGHTRVFVTHRLDDCGGEPIAGVFNWLNEGGRVRLLSNGVLQEAFTNMYRTVPYNMGTTGNMGTVIHAHPALGDFPHEGWCDVAFVPLIQGAYPMRLDPFRPQRIKPIIRSNGHQVTMDDKAYLFEVGVGKGVLLACSLNLQPHCHVYPAARHLLHCLMQYLAEGDCVPAASITTDQLKAAMRTTPPVSSTASSHAHPTDHSR
ncbi:MAG TPA: hypothetical protein VNA16_10185, partial [Abditibacteriaceae bacterium]|nr:hypothetical protein [Abditibacteriaceae bacterium]